MKTLEEKVDAILATLEVNGMIHVTEEKEVKTINKIYPIEFTTTDTIEDNILNSSA